MDLVQLLLFWSLAVSVQLVDFAKHRDRLQLLQRVERRVAEQRHRRMHPLNGRLPNKSHGTELSSVTVVHETGCKRSLSCPLSKTEAKVPCVKLRALCDDVRDCPKGEDEDPVSCLFFKMTKHFVSVAVEQVAMHH